MTSNQSSSPNPAEPPKIYVGRLRRDIELFRGEYDSEGNPTWVIFDPVSDSYFRISDEDYRIVSAIHGVSDVDTFIGKLKDSGINVDKERVMKVLSFLNNSNLMHTVYQHTHQKVEKIQEARRKMIWDILLSSYLFFKIPLLRPDRFLARTVSIMNAIFNKWTFLVLGLIAFSGYVSLIVKWHKLADVFIKSISVAGLMRYSIAVIVIKIIHEFSHAYAAKVCGVRVRKMGIAFIVFFPRLYTDLTDAWRIASRKKRFLIDSAGIISEIIIGGGAAMVWANSAPGLTNTIAYYIFAVSIINTVLINGNPFIRYDGYYMLMDIVNIDNLQRRGIERVQYIWRKHLFGIDYTLPDEIGGWNKHFLIAYGISAFIYRFFLYTSIIMIVYYQFNKIIGIVLLMLEVYLLVIKPLIGEIKRLIAFKQKIKRRNFLFSMTGLGMIAFLLIIPLPWSISLPCEVKPVESEMIYARISGFLEMMLVKDGQTVHKGQRLLTQSNPVLGWRLKEALLEKEIDRLQIDQAQSSAELLAGVNVAVKAWESSKTQIEELCRKQDLLSVPSNVDGVFSLYDQHLKSGKWLEKGEVVGEVFCPDRQKVFAYVQEEEIKDIRLNDKAEVSMSDEIKIYSGRITAVNSVPAVFTLSPLLNVFEGPIMVYPSGDGTFMPLTTCYQIEITLDYGNQIRSGRTGTAWIQKYSSIGGNLVRNTIHVLLRELSF
ncbi:MAG: site-2 protease family protein [Victivallaceae bacterium]